MISDGYKPRRLRGHAQCSTAQPTLLSTPHERQTHSAVLYVFCKIDSILTTTTTSSLITIPTKWKQSACAPPLLVCSVLR
ncbi:hypothetical protein GALMADRAFT_934612 [Galerina marginata CBS 339.88]|uniref:Uncharacterized protein n=1 Tax=Galerina marginata (strain CBS 339.88) TaxID=685588 RepID=A0A067SN34_GALM3|nr:hypothetical protein GALMADRAFT_934612 [Galerina marginata CBS 339.88]